MAIDVIAVQYGLQGNRGGQRLPQTAGGPDRRHAQPLRMPAPRISQPVTGSLWGAGAHPARGYPAVTFLRSSCPVI